MKHGIIRGLSSSGGLVTITVADIESGRVDVLYGDNGPTIRRLAACYRNVIIPGHRFNPDAVIGAEIDYEVADWDPRLIEYFEPVEVMA